jgi:hypothetical protein
MQISMTVGIVQTLLIVSRLRGRKIKRLCLTSLAHWRVILMNNKELTQKEFDVSMNIKFAMNCLMNENLLGTKEYLAAALNILHERKPVGI